MHAPCAVVQLFAGSSMLDEVPAGMHMISICTAC